MMDSSADLANSPSAFATLKNILSGAPVPRKEFISLATEVDAYELFYGANLLRQSAFGNKVNFCSLINAKSGKCSENCNFCAQSAHHKGDAAEYPFVDPSEIDKAFSAANVSGTHRFDIVTSGNELSEQDFKKVVDSISRLNKREDRKVSLCVSIGRLSLERALILKDAGVTRAHHNLETSRNFFPKVCTTHTYDERVETVRNLKKAGLDVCSGGIFGIGESWEDRVDLAMELKELGVSAVPLNFLIPIKGTPAGSNPPMPPLDILRTVSLFRFIMPDKDIRVCGGREQNLRDLQSWVFFAGASSIMIGGYLTRKGRPVEDDLRMVKDLGLDPNRD